MPSWKKVILSGSDAALNSLDVTTNVTATSFTGSLLGTASFADQALTASFAISASYAPGTGQTLQQVTDNGNTTTNNITASGLLSLDDVYVSSSKSYYLGADSYLRRETNGGGFENIQLNGSVRLNPNTSANANNGVIIGGNGYLLAPNSSRNAQLNYGSVSGQLGVFRLNVYGGDSIFQQSVDITGSLEVLGGITGSLLGTASYAAQSLSASYAATASSADSFNIRTALTASGLIYPTLDGTLNQSIVTDGAGNLTFGDPFSSNTVVNGKNVSGGTIEKGTPLYFTASGAAGNIVGVLPADAGNPARMPAGGIAGEQMLDEAEGVILLNGFINGVNTSAFASGDQVYVAVGGGYTNVVPTGSALVQKLGNVEKSDASNGSGVINGPGAVRSVPNINPGYTWVGNSDWVATPVSTASLFVTSASYADQALSASFAISASYAPGTSQTLQQVLNNGNTATSSISLLGNITSSGLLTDNFAVNDTLGIGPQIFYAQGADGFSVNENFDAGGPTQTAYHFTSGDVNRTSVVFSLARTTQFTSMFGITGSNSDNKFVIGTEFANTDFEWRKSLGISPVSLQGGTLLARLDRSGSLYVTSNITGSNLSINDISAQSLNATSITASLLGTASHALNADNAISSSHAIFADTASFLPSTTNLNITSISASTAVFQSASIGYLQTVTGSATIIGDAFILLNTNDAQRYAGLLVEDSGSDITNYTASFFFDSQLNDWNYEYTTTASTDYGVALFGPEYNTKGSPTYLTANRIPKAEGTHHLNDSNISDDGTTVSINSNTEVTGSLNVTTNITAESLNVTSGTGSFTGSFSGVFDGISAGQIATGTGTVNTIAKWNTTSSLSDSSITDNGSVVKIAVNTVVTGSIINNNAGFTSTTYTSGSSIADATTNETLFTIDATVYESLTMDYVIFDSTKANKRAGTLRSTWDDNTTAVVFDETTTTDIGNTSGFTLNTSNNGTGTVSVRATNNVGSAVTIIYEYKLLG